MPQPEPFPSTNVYARPGRAEGKKKKEKKNKTHNLFSILDNVDSQDPAKFIFPISLQQHLDSFLSPGCSCSGNLCRRKLFPWEETLQKTR